jgi:MFS transporter, OFA family, oxalate/formate antiporter
MHRLPGQHKTGDSPALSATTWRARLAQRLPFYYGWVVFAVVASLSYSARPLMSVAVLSVFVLPMTQEFGWSRGLFSGAVSLGGLCAVTISPVIGRLLDKYGASLILSGTAAVAGLCAVCLSGIHQAWTFYAVYVPGRMAFASPLELATSTSLSNWFLQRRALLLGLYGVTQGTGLAVMPLVAQFMIAGWGWRRTWIWLGCYTLAVGILPSLLLLARRPEDMGLLPDTAPRRQATAPTVSPRRIGSQSRALPEPIPERHFTLRQAMATRAFWMLSVFSAVGFMTQAGVSLHQVSHYIHQGLPSPAATMMASVFAMAQVPAGLLWSTLTRHFSVRYVLAIAGFSVALGAAGTAWSTTFPAGVIVSSILGSGVGGLHLLLRLAWADYYGRQHLGTIQGITLPIQIGGQALGPVTAGVVFDATGDYQYAFFAFACLVALGSLLVLPAVPPRQGEHLPAAAP